MSRFLCRNLTSSWQFRPKISVLQKALKSRRETVSSDVDCSKYRKRGDGESERPVAMPISIKEATSTPEELEYERKWRTEPVDTPKVESLADTNLIPEELQRERTARIYKETKNTMQSGTYNTRFWKVGFDNQERWENPLMGWISSGDPISNVKLNFRTLADAIRHCERNGWDYYVDRPRDVICYKVRKYDSNYSWNKRYRVSTK